MPTFEAPNFDIWQLVFTGIGVSVFWGKWGRSKLKPFYLATLTRTLPVRMQAPVEFLVFLVLGCLVAVATVEPRNAIQALVAGFAWTGVFANPERPTRKSSA